VVDRPSGADAAAPATPTSAPGGSGPGSPVPATGSRPVAADGPPSSVVTPEPPVEPAVRSQARSERFDSGISFRSRLTIALIAAAVLPLASFGLVVVAAQRLLPDPASTVPRILLLTIAIAALLAVLVAFALAADLTAPLRAIAAAVDRVSTGDLSAPIVFTGDDELARLAESHNRLAGELERRNRELGRILAALVAASPRDGVDWLIGRAAEDARTAFGMVDARIVLVDPATVPSEERVPGEPLPVRAALRAGEDRLGVLVGHLPATRTWERADQDLLELFASEIGVAVRNAQLFERVGAQNSRLLELDAAKDDFLRGVSHNLQTPLTSIRAYAERLAAERPDRRLGIIAEQAERLSRMVRQLLTVSRLEAGTLRPEADVFGLAPRVRRAWEALGVETVELTVDDRSGGWLAVADADQLDQVLWALLDNAVKYGRREPVTVLIAVDDAAGHLRLTISDHGPGIPSGDRERLFTRFTRVGEQSAEDGSGLGLYVSRELVRSMAGDLRLEPESDGGGAAFTVELPAEQALES
jgi:signal transduction histidine kinase/HAMP domain-containing protein